jgi:L-threonylcarbamoyladenylate synthase
MSPRESAQSMPEIGSIGVLATDTIYGVVARALDEQAVARLYKLKGRTPTKPFIILISDISHVSLFGVKVDNALEATLKKYWPGPVSIILPTSRKDLAYLHRGQNSLAFRLPAKKDLTDLIVQTGPLVAPSANPEGLAPAETIAQAKAYFGDSVDFYIDSGRVVGKPSKIIKIISGQLQIIRD